MDKLTAPNRHNNPNYVYLMVSSDGLVYWDYNARVLEIHQASLIIREEDGRLVVRKERYDFVPQGCELTVRQAGILAVAHLMMTCEDIRLVFGDRYDIQKWQQLTRGFRTSVKLLDE